MATKAQRRRWICPVCKSGKLAPSRPRKDDTRRYCLPCSDRSGRLVQRSCPSVERKAAAKSERRAQTKLHESARRCEGETLSGVHIPSAARVLWSLPVMRDARAEFGRSRQLPEIRIRRRSDGFTSGRAFPSQHRIVLSIGEGVSAVAIKELLLHELAHIVCPSREHHGSEFRRVLCQAATEAWGTTIRTGDARRVYDLDRLIRNELLSQ